MTGKLSIIKNMVSYGGEQIFSKIFGFLFIVYAARALGEFRFGIFATAFNYATIFYVVAVMGTDQATIIDVAKSRKDAARHFINILLYRFLAAIVCSGLYILYFNILGHFRPFPEWALPVFYVVTLHVVVESVRTFIVSTLQGFERMEIPAAISTAGSLAGTSTGILLLYLQFRLEHVALALVALNGLQVLVLLYLVFTRFLPRDWKLDFSYTKSALLRAWKLGVVSLYAQLHAYLDYAMLQLLLVSYAKYLSFYEAAWKIMLLLAVLPFSMNMAFMPVLTRLYSESKEKVFGLCERISKLAAVLGVPVAVLTIAYTREIIRLVYGQGYMAARHGIYLMMIPWFLIFVLTPLKTALTTSYHITTYIPTLYGILGLNIVLNFFLIQGYDFGIDLTLPFVGTVDLAIPPLNYRGAALATVITNFLGNLLHIYKFNRLFGRRIHPFRIITVPLLIGSVSFGVIIGLRSLSTVEFGLLDILAGLAGVTVYVGLVVALRVLDREEVASLIGLYRSLKDRVAPSGTSGEL